MDFQVNAFEQEKHKLMIHLNNQATSLGAVQYNALQYLTFYQVWRTMWWTVDSMYVVRRSSIPKTTRRFAEVLDWLLSNINRLFGFRRTLKSVMASIRQSPRRSMAILYQMML